MPEELAPPVVAVVVTSDPGSSFERCLESLCGQEYLNLALLVVDDGSAIDLTSRVAAIEPAAIVRRRPARAGYAAAANEALEGVAGATFFLFCHDDVELEPNTLAMLVEESFRANAAVVGPKLVDTADPHLLRQVGLGMHRLGTPSSRVRPGELDQAQHDEARDVFAVPGACTLIRADLFEALGGYDPEMSMFGEDVDFCWRAQIAGARVAVAPLARVRHEEAAASGARAVGDVALLRRRHELRAALKNYGLWRRSLVTLELVVVAMAEMLVGMASGERERARTVARAWRWNVGHRRSLRGARRHLRQVRQVPDRVLVAHMVREGRLRRYLRTEPPERSASRRPALGGEYQRRGTWWTRAQHGEVPAAQLTLAGLLVVVGLLGLRDVLFARLPLVGQFVPMPTGSTMLGQFLGGLDRGSGVQAAPTAFGLVGALGSVLGDSTAMAWKVITVGSFVVGAVGVSRLCKPFGSSRARLVGAATFVVLPLAWNALATGNVAAAVTMGASPFVLGRLGRATGLVPFGTRFAGEPRPDSAPEDGRADRSAHGLLGEVAPLGLLLAVLAALAPAGLLACGALLAGVLLTCLLNGRPVAAGRALLVSTGALAVAFCCCLPWSLTWFEHGAQWSALSGVVPNTPTSAASVLRGHVGPIGAWWGTWGIVAAAGYALVVARGERLVWATAWWLAAVAATAFAWAGSEGFLGAGGGATAVLAAPGAVALAAACGLGAAAFEHDVVARSSLGWRQAAAGLGVACLIAGAVPALGIAIGGRADLPTEGIDQTLDWTQPAAAHPYRVLWLGDPRSLPAAGWQLAPGLAWYTAAGGLPRADQVWPEASPGRLSAAAADIVAAERGRTADVGALLARLGVRYLVLPVSDAPVLPGTQVPPVVAVPPPSLVAALRIQNDLVERPIEAGADVFVNADWSPRDGAGAVDALGPGADGGLSSPAWRRGGLAVGLLIWLLAIGEGVTRRRRWDRRPAGGSTMAVPGLRVP